MFTGIGFTIEVLDERTLKLAKCLIDDAKLTLQEKSKV